MDNFKSFITEQVRDKITVLILTNSKSKKPELVTGKLLKACADLGLPCHRVIKSDGGLGGFTSVGGIKLKKKILAFEKNCKQ